jgi:hypothetical protein
MKQDNFDIISKWLINGFPDYCFGSDKELYRFPHKSGRNHYGLLKVKKQPHNRWLIHGKFWSENQLADKIYLNPNPEVLISSLNDCPF